MLCITAQINRNDIINCYIIPLAIIYEEYGINSIYNPLLYEQNIMFNT